MGTPLGPTLSNIFLAHHEENWLQSGPTQLFKPIVHRRYVDDTFTCFSDPSNADKFLTYLNSKHPNISFILRTTHCLP